jgi:hypothetical protein
MVKKRNAPRIGGLQGADLEPAPAMEEMAQHTTQDHAGLSPKQQRDKHRVRLRPDVDPAVKTAVELAAAEYQTSVSQMANFLLAYAATLYYQNDPRLLDELDQCLVNARAIHHTYDVDLDAKLRPEGAGKETEPTQKSVLARLTEIAKPQ